VSPDTFNKATGLPVILPITNGGEFAKKIGFSVALSGGTKTTGFVRCDQPRVIDIKARGGRRVELLPSLIIDEILAKVVTIFV